MVNLDEIEAWKVETEEDVKTEKGLELTFVKYVRK